MDKLEEKITNILRHEAKQIAGLPPPDAQSWADFIAHIVAHRRVVFGLQNIQIDDRFPLAVMALN